MARFYSPIYVGRSIRVEGFFGYLKERTKRFYNNINTEKIENIEEIVKAIATLHNIINQVREVIPT